MDGIFKAIILGAIALTMLGALGGTIITSFNSTNLVVTGAAKTMADTVFPLVFVAAGILLLFALFLKQK